MAHIGNTQHTHCNAYLGPEDCCHCLQPGPFSWENSRGREPLRSSCVRSMVSQPCAASPKAQQRCSHPLCGQGTQGATGWLQVAPSLLLQ